MGDICYDYEEITLSSGALGFTAAKINAWKDYNPSVLVYVADNAITWLLTGATPTASTKNQSSAGNSLWITGYQNLKNFLAIKRDAGTAVLAVHYFR
jgi:hypothetical protein